MRLYILSPWHKVTRIASSTHHGVLSPLHGGTLAPTTILGVSYYPFIGKETELREVKRLVTQLVRGGSWELGYRLG